MFIHFHRYFLHAVWSVKSIFLMLIGLIVLGAFLISVTEAQPFGDALYFASITGLTVGYGDTAIQNVAADGNPRRRLSNAGRNLAILLVCSLTHHRLTPALAGNG